MGSLWLTVLVLGALVSGADAQTRRRTPPAPATKVEAIALACPHDLGQGVATQRAFCDIQADTDPLAGAIVRLPPHRGAAILTFDLHNRHMLLR